MPLSARSFVVAVGALITAGLVEVAAEPGPRSRVDFGAMGTAKLLIPWDANSGERGRGPQILPDSREVLFTLVNASDSDSQIVAESLDTRERRVLIEGGTDARYLPTGHLVYALAGNLLAVPFALDRLEVIGGPVPLVEGVAYARRSGGANFDISADGMLVYLPRARGTNALRTLVWVDRDGREEPLAAEPRDYDRARISPDGTKAVLSMGDGDLWVLDFARETLTRLRSTQAEIGAPSGCRMARTWSLPPTAVGR